MGMGPNVMDLVNDHLGFDNPTKTLFHGASLNDKDWVSRGEPNLVPCDRCHLLTDHPKRCLGPTAKCPNLSNICTDCYILMHEDMDKFLEGWEVTV